MPSVTHYLTLFVSFALCAAQTVSAGEPTAAGEDFFERKIRPVLVANCYECHSVEAEKAGRLKGRLLLDSRDALRKGGESGLAIVPGDAANSLLLSAIRHSSLKMPPSRKLSDKVIADFAAWIAMGAPDPRDGNAASAVPTSIAGQTSWALSALQTPEVPAMGGRSWVRTPVDAFVLKRLDEAGLAPSDVAERRTLIRRLSFDLRGLPASPEEVDAFVSDPQPDAYGRLVDRFLGSPTYGERWARHWLDVARFMESNGDAHDEIRRGAYEFRDFVIRAFNDDMPFDEFVRLQIGGDLLKPNDRFATAATGFLAAGPFATEQSEKERERFRYDQFDDIISTIGTGMLGLTVGCARCHDHKYDPVSSDDYYRMIACFANTGFEHVSFDTDPDGYQKATEAFDRTHQPFVDNRMRYERDVLSAKLAEWERDHGPTSEPQWLVLKPVKVMSTGGASFRTLLDGSTLVEGLNVDRDDYFLNCTTDLTGIRGFRIEAISDPSLPGGGSGRAADGGFELSEFEVQAKAKSDPGDLARIALRNARANSFEGHVTASALIDGDSMKPWIVNQDLHATHSVAVTADKEIGFPGGTTLFITLRFQGTRQHNLGRFRISVCTTNDSGVGGVDPDTIDIHADAASPEVFAALRQPAAERSVEAREALLHWFGQKDDGWRECLALEEDHFFKRPRPLLADVYAARVSGATYIFPDRYKVYFLERGEPERKQTLAEPGLLKVLTADPVQPEPSATNSKSKALPNRQPRVALAEWLTEVERGAGALVARVIVNRLWQHHFGRGIVETPNDFGLRGERPSHPEVIDYLAAELIRNGWRLKPIHKLILTSSVYMQRSDVTSAGLEKDPENRLFWRRAPMRLEAEVLRDAMLAAGGKLDSRMYGPGTSDEAMLRRSIYFTNKYAQPIRLMQVFDAPYAASGIGRRSNSTGTMQALAMMNSDTVHALAENFAQRISTSQETNVATIVEEAWSIAFSRTPTNDERDLAYQTIERLMRSHGSAPDARERALADFCKLLFCSNEFIYVD